MEKQIIKLQEELFQHFPQWKGNLKIIEYLSGEHLGKNPPYVKVKSLYGFHIVSLRNLRSGNYPSIKTAIDKFEYSRNFNEHQIKIFCEEIFTKYPQWKSQLEFIEYLSGKSFKSKCGKTFTGGPYIKVKSELGVHLASVAHLRKGNCPSERSLIEYSDKPKTLNYTDEFLLQRFRVHKKFKNLCEIENIVDTSKISFNKIEIITRGISWYLVEDILYGEFFFQRKPAIASNTVPSIKTAFDEISYLNKITPNQKRKFPIKVICIAGKIREERAYMIEWCGCTFIKEQSWITDESGREPLQLKGSILDIVQTANRVLQYICYEMAQKFIITKYLPNRKSPRIIITDPDGVEYDSRWSDLLEGKFPSVRSAVDSIKHLTAEMKKKIMTYFKVLRSYQLCSIKKGDIINFW